MSYPGPAVRDRVDVGEHEGERRDRVDHEHDLEHPPQVRHDDVPERGHRRRPVDPGGLLEPGIEGAHARDVEQDVVAEVRPDDDQQDHGDRRRRASEPLALERLQADLAEPVVDRAVELERGRRQDADHDRRVHGGQEHGRPEEAPAGDPQVDRVGDEQRDDDLDRHRQREQEVVAQREAEDRGRATAPGSCGSRRTGPG